MASDYTITLTATSSISGKTVYTPNNDLNGKITLHAYPTSSTVYKVGSLIGDGTYVFSEVDDGRYKLYEDVACTKEISRWGGTNGKWIGDDNMEYYATSASLSTNITTLSASAATALGTVSSSLASSISTLSGSVVSNYLIMSASNSSVRNVSTVTKFTRGLYYTGDTNSSISVINRTAMEGYVSGIVVNNTASYQQSPNIKRLVPNGSVETNRLELTYSQSLGLCSDASVTKQYTIEIEGEGTNASAIVLDTSGSVYFKPYVHVKGYGADVKLQVPSEGWTEAEASGSIGEITLENLLFYFDDGDNDSTNNYKGIIFKNCKFYNIGLATSIFTDCVFEGANYFTSLNDNQFIFTNCKGNRIFSENQVIVNGTNYIGVDYLNATRIKTITVKDTGGNLNIDGGVFMSGSIAISGSIKIDGIGYRNPPIIGLETFTNQYGGALGNAIVLAEPDKWITITIDGTAYSIPAYQQ